MSDTIVLHVYPAQILERLYQRAIDAVVTDIEGFGRALDSARPFLPYLADGDSGARAVGYLQALADQLSADHDDLAWRIDYVETLAADGVLTAIPRRTDHLRRQRVADLVAMLHGDEHDAAMAELTIRAITDRDASRAIARELGADGIEALRDRLHDQMIEVTLSWDLHGYSREEGWVESAEAEAAAFDETFQLYGALLASFSHHDEGREVLEAVFHLEQPDTDTNFLPVALLHGDWDDAFLYDLYERIFTTPSDFWGGYGRLAGAMEIVESEFLFPRLIDPHTVLLEAIGRQPDLARRLVLEEGAFRRLMEFDDYGPFGGTDLERAYGISRMSGGSRLGDGLAALFEAALIDPHRSEQIYDFLGGGSTIDAQGYEVHVPGLFHDIAELGLPRSAELRQVLADVWNLQWHNVASLDNGIRPTDDVGGAVLVEIFTDETARLEVMAGFGAYLEVLYAGAFVDGSPEAIAEAGVGAHRGFGHLHHALSELQPDSTDRSLLRSAFRTGAGFGAKQLLPFLGGPPTWSTVGLGFVVGQVISEAGDRLLPDDVSRYPTSRSVLHDLFVATPAHVGPPLPTDAEVIFANAALTAHPELAVEVEPSRWLVDGVIQPPSGDDAAAFDDFGFLYGRNFTGDSPFQPMITAPALDVASWLATTVYLDE